MHNQQTKELFLESLKKSKLNMLLRIDGKLFEGYLTDFFDDDKVIVFISEVFCQLNDKIEFEIKAAFSNEKISGTGLISDIISDQKFPKIFHVKVQKVSISDEDYIKLSNLLMMIQNKVKENFKKIIRQKGNLDDY